MKIILAFMIFMTPAFAHDAAGWIMDGQYRNRAGAWCCGINDCKMIAGVKVTSLPAPGYRLPSGEFIHQNDAMRSIDQHYWRCHQADGTTRCFFAPAIGF